MTTDKPLFLPLRRVWFDAFRSGEKRIEWRAWGPHWNARTVIPGRSVILSLGYSGARLYGVVTQGQCVAQSEAPDAARAIYPNATHLCAIHVALDIDAIDNSASAAALFAMPGPM